METRPDVPAARTDPVAAAKQLALNSAEEHNRPWWQKVRNSRRFGGRPGYIDIRRGKKTRSR